MAIRSGVSNSPIIQSFIPTKTMTDGTISALQPSISRFFHGLASILGNDGIINIPNGQIRRDLGNKAIENKAIDGSGIGVR